MSLGLGLCVFVMALGVGVMMLAIIKRNQLMIQSVVYSSFGSLRRLKDRNYLDENEKAKTQVKDNKHKRQVSVGNEGETNNDITTTMEVAFFPQYSLVNKSMRKAPFSSKEKKSRETKQKKQELGSRREVSEEHLNGISTSTPKKGIFSSLKFKTSWDPKKMEDHRNTSTSFYHQHTGHSKTAHDLRCGHRKHKSKSG